MILDDIVKAKKQQIEKAKLTLPQDGLMRVLESRKVRTGPTLEAHLDFKAAINKPGKVSLIAEIKKASPSEGLICKDFDPIRIARIYQEEGADALSVLTEEDFFQGQLSYISEVREAVSLAVLRKDFLIDGYQLYESALLGADAVLLIASILSEGLLSKFLTLAAQLKMDTMVEVHSDGDLEKALKTGAQIIGINNRDLRSFRVDLDTTARLMKSMPKDKIAVSESGIKSHEDVKFLKNLGIKAVLIGEAFLSAPDIGAKVREVMGA